MSTEEIAELPITERSNPRSENLSSQSTLQIVELMNDEDGSVALAVKRVLPDVASAVDQIVSRLKS